MLGFLARTILFPFFWLLLWTRFSLHYVYCCLLEFKRLNLWLYPCAGTSSKQEVDQSQDLFERDKCFLLVVSARAEVVFCQSPCVRKPKSSRFDLVRHWFEVVLGPLRPRLNGCDGSEFHRQVHSYSYLFQ